MPAESISRRIAARCRPRPPRSRERILETLRQRFCVLPRHDRHVVAKDFVQLEAAWMIGRDDRRSRRQGLDRDCRKSLEQRRKHEDVGHRRVARDHVVGDEAGEGHLGRDSERRGPFFEIVLEGAGPTDDEPDVVAAARDSRERLDEISLAGQFVQPLDVEDDERFVDAELDDATRRACPDRAARTTRSRAGTRPTAPDASGRARARGRAVRWL